MGRLVGALVAAALAEFMLLRLLIRLGPMLPPWEEVARLAHGMIFIGMVALNLAILLALVVLFLAVVLTPYRLLAGLMSLIVLAVLALKTAPGVEGLFIAYTGLVLATMAMAWILPFRAYLQGNPTDRKAVSGLKPVVDICILMALATGAYPIVVASSSRLGWVLPPVPAAPFVAEGLAVMAALLAWPAYRPRWSQSATAITVGVIILVTILATLRSWLVSILAMWTVAFTLFLPFPVYALALGFFVYTLIALVRGDLAQRRQGYGLLLIAMAGLKWDYSYLSLLAVVGFILLTFPETDG